MIQNTHDSRQIIVLGAAEPSRDLSLSEITPKPWRATGSNFKVLSLRAACSIFDFSLIVFCSRFGEVKKKNTWHRHGSVPAQRKSSDGRSSCIQLPDTLISFFGEFHMFMHTIVFWRRCGRRLFRSSAAPSIRAGAAQE